MQPYKVATSADGCKLNELAHCLAMAAVKARRQMAGQSTSTADHASTDEAEDDAIYRAWYHYFLQLQLQDSQIQSSLQQNESLVDTGDDGRNTQIEATSVGGQFGGAAGVVNYSTPAPSYRSVANDEPSANANFETPQGTHLQTWPTGYHLEQGYPANLLNSDNFHTENEFNKYTSPWQSPVAPTYRDTQPGFVGQTEQAVPPTGAQCSTSQALLLAQLVQQCSIKPSNLQSGATLPTFSPARSAFVPIASTNLPAYAGPVGEPALQNPPHQSRPEVAQFHQSFDTPTSLPGVVSSSIIGTYPSGGMEKQISNFSAPAVASPKPGPSRKRSVSSMDFPNVQPSSSEPHIVQPVRSRYRLPHRDRFVIRIVRITCAGGSEIDSSRSSKPRSDTKTTSCPSTDLKTYITFNAQLPNLGGVSRRSRVELSPHVSTGLRLNFSVALNSNGPKPEDFLSSKVDARLKHWEEAVDVPGLRTVVVKALCDMSALILKRIREQGPSAVGLEKEYIFYPFTGELESAQPRNRPFSASSDSSVPRVEASKPHLVNAPVNQAVNLSGLAPVRRRSKTMHPSLVMDHIVSLQKQNPDLAGMISPDRMTKSATDAFITSKTTPPGRTNDAHLISAGQSRSFSTNLRTIWPHPPANVEPKSLLPNQVSGFNNAHTLPLTVSGISQFISQLPTMSDPLHSSANSVESFDAIHRMNCPSAGLKELSVNEMSRLVPENPRINSAVHEVSVRLHQNPELPIVVMPRSAVSSPSRAGGPLVFQLPNPRSLFVGLPASSDQLPRVVTAPTSTSLVLLPKIHHPSPQQVKSTQHTHSQPLILTGPRPGYVLMITPDNNFQYIPLVKPDD